MHVLLHRFGISVWQMGNRVESLEHFPLEPEVSSLQVVIQMRHRARADDDGRNPWLLQTPPERDLSR